MAVVLVARSLGRAAVTTYAPSPVAPRDVGPALVGPVTTTVDAMSGEAWAYFDFSRGSVVADPAPTEWDLGFQRFRIIANGGPGMAGQAGILDLGEPSFATVSRVPQKGYAVTEIRGGDSVNPAIEQWYDYSWSTHLLEPRATTYAVRTADGRFAKMQIVGYYCPGVRGGCVTFRYVYQGTGERDVDVSASVPPAP